MLNLVPTASPGCLLLCASSFHKRVLLIVGLQLLSEFVDVRVAVHQPPRAQVIPRALAKKGTDQWRMMHRESRSRLPARMLLGEGVVLTPHSRESTPKLPCFLKC